MRDKDICTLYGTFSLMSIDDDIRIRLYNWKEALTLLGIDFEIRDLWCIGNSSELFNKFGVDSQERDGWNRAIIAGVDLV